MVCKYYKIIFAIHSICNITFSPCTCGWLGWKKGRGCGAHWSADWQLHRRWFRTGL